MKFYKILPLILIVGLLTLGISCTKKSDFENGPIESEWLLPLLKGNIGLKTVSNLNDRSFTFSVSRSDLGSPTTPTSNIYTDVGPFILDIPGIIDSIFFADCLFDLTINNHFSSTIEAGTKMVITNAGTSSSIFSYRFEQDLADNESKTFVIDLSNKHIGSQIEVYFDTLKTTNYPDHDDRSIDAKMTINKIDIDGLYIKTGESFSLEDTTDFDGSSLDFENDGLQGLDTSIKADIQFIAENYLPLNISFQAYFLDGQNNIVDSLFKPTGHVDGATYSGGNLTKQESSFTTHIAKDRIENIKKAKKIMYQLEFNSNGYSVPSIYVDGNNQSTIKVIGDIHLTLNPINFLN